MIVLQKIFLPVLALVFLASSTSVLLVTTNTVEALSGTSFKAGRIIDDAIFYNKNSMTPQQIKQFLDAKVPVCDRNRVSTNPTYQPPWTCLKEYQENTTTKEHNIGRFNGDGTPYNVPGGKSAAQIIWDVGQQYGINPQVLIVMLQKEQSLITDNWPWKIQYDRAMGYACPDTAPCDAQYYGFYNQVSSAAWQLKRYIQLPDNYNFKSGVTRFVGYNPSASCSGSNVFIENAATAALYNYTPYQPNTAALNNLYGTGDSCSAYGNRNFWRMFNDWFGSTVGPYYYFQSAKNPPSKIPYGEIVNAQLKIINNSSEVWYSDGHLPAGKKPFRIMNKGYSNSSFANVSDPAWLGTKNQIRMSEPSVAPGGTATFNFSFRSPNETIKETFDMILVQDGIQVYVDLGLQFRLSSTPDYSYRLVDANPITGLLPGDMYEVVIKTLNTGSKPWYSDNNLSGTNPRPIRLATKYYKNSPYASPSFDKRWLGTNNQIKLIENVVEPGGVGTFKAILTAPYDETSFLHEFQLVLDGIKFLPGDNIFMNIKTEKPNPDYEFVSAINPPTSMSPGTETVNIVKIRNSGNMVWRGFDIKVLSKDRKRVILGDFRMITLAPGYHSNPFANNDPRWLGTSNQLKMKELVVAPGQIATFEIPYKAPDVKGSHIEYFGFAIDGFNTLKDLGLAYSVNVK